MLCLPQGQARDLKVSIAFGDNGAEDEKFSMKQQIVLSTSYERMLHQSKVVTNEK